MKSRLPFTQLAPEPYASMMAVGTHLEASSLGREFIELIYLRVSQINGCAFCLNKHSKALRSGGTATEKIDSLAGWHVSAVYSEKERAALHWAEALTDVQHTHAPEEAFAPLRQHFTDKEIVELTFAISNMNALNRLAIGMRL